MWSTKEIVIFLAGAEAFHTLSHYFLAQFIPFPMQIWSFRFTKQYNTYAIIINAIITIALLWWSQQLG